MPPHRELNPRFQAHIARARRVRVVSVGLLVTCLLVGTGSALAMLAPQGNGAQAAIKNSLASVADTFDSVGTAFSHATASISNNLFTSRNQVAAVSSDDSISNRIYRFFCPWFTDCDEPATEFTTNTTPTPPVQPRPQPTYTIPTTTPVTTTQRTGTSQPVQQTVVNNPVIERVIERVVQGAPASLAGYVTQADLLSQIAAVKSSVGTQLYGDWYNNPGSSSNNGGIVGTIGMMGRIDSLSGTELSDITVDGVSGLTDADIPDGITAANYLLLTGGAITGNLSLSGTLTAGSLAVSGVSSGGAIEAPYFTATSTSASSTFPNLNATNATTTNATSTNMFSTLGRFTTAIADAFSAVSATITNLTSTTLVATNATTTRLDAFDYVAVGRTATTTIRGDGVASTIPYASSTAITVSGTASTSNLVVSNSFTLGNLTGFLKATAGAITSALVDLASNVTGILPVGNGGTGQSAIAANAIVLGNGTGAVATTSAGSNGQVLALVGGVPSWVATTTLSTISGTLGVASGGTGQTTFSSSQLLYGNGTGGLLSVATSSASCSSGIACSSFTVVGSVAPSITFSAPAGSALSIPFASSTAVSISGTGFFGTASTTNFNLSGTANLQSLAADSLLYNNSSRQLAAASVGSSLSFTGSSLSLNLGNGNTWTGLQQFYGAASSTLFSANWAKFGATASSTFGTDGTLTMGGNIILNGKYLSGDGGNEGIYVDTSGNVGIGTTTPQARLSASGADDATFGQLTINSTGGNAGISFSNASGLGSAFGRGNITMTNSANAQGMAFGLGGTTYMTLSGYPTAGNVGIGTTNPNEGKVEVKGGTVCVDTDSNDSATSCIANESDERLKENITSISASSSLDIINALNPVSFDWRASDPEILSHYPLLGRYAGNTHSIGLIAQQVMPVLPEALSLETVGDAEVQYFQLDYTKFIPHLIGAVKELWAKVQDLGQKVAALFESVEEQNAKIQALEARVNQLEAQTGAAGAPSGGGANTPAPEPEPDPIPEGEAEEETDSPATPSDEPAAEIQPPSENPESESAEEIEESDTESTPESTVEPEPIIENPESTDTSASE